MAQIAPLPFPLLIASPYGQTPEPDASEAPAPVTLAQAEDAFFLLPNARAVGDLAIETACTLVLAGYFLDLPTEAADVDVVQFFAAEMAEMEEV